jgi:hypothetical protein
LCRSHSIHSTRFPGGLAIVAADMEGVSTGRAAICCTNVQEHTNQHILRPSTSDRGVIKRGACLVTIAAMLLAVLPCTCGITVGLHRKGELGTEAGSRKRVTSDKLQGGNGDVRDRYGWEGEPGGAVDKGVFTTKHTTYTVNTMDPTDQIGEHKYARMRKWLGAAMHVCNFCSCLHLMCCEQRSMLLPTCNQAGFFSIFTLLASTNGIHSHQSIRILHSSRCG